MKKQENYVQIKKGGRISSGFFYIAQKEESGMISCNIPAFDIWFSASSEEEATHRAKSMVNTFFRYWILDAGWKQFVLQLHKLGFKTSNHNFTIKPKQYGKPKTITVRQTAP